MKKFCSVMMCVMAVLVFVLCIWNSSSAEAAVKKTSQVTSQKKKVSVKKPGQVKNLKAKAGESCVNLSWNKVKNAKGYIVYKINTKTKKRKQIAITKSGTTVKYKVKYLKNGVKWTFRVAAYSGTATKPVIGKLSGTASAVPKMKKVGKPELTAVTVGKKSITMKWKSCKNATGYEVYIKRKNAKKYTQVGKRLSAKKTSIKISNLKSGKYYYIKVRAVREVYNQLSRSEFAYVQQKLVSKSQQQKVLNEIVQYASYGSSDTSKVYSRGTAETFANIGNYGKAFESSNNYFIWVNLYTMRCFVFKRANRNSRWNLVFHTPCIIGRMSAQTPRTTWTIVSRIPVGEGAYWVSYLQHGTYAIHSLQYHQDPVLRAGYLASAGCIRLMIPQAKYIYDHCFGSTVLTR